MLSGILWAEIQNEPMKGWPLGASIAVAGGVDPERAREIMLDGIAEERKRLDEMEKHLRGLPAVTQEAVAEVRAAVAVQKAEIEKSVV